MSVYEDEQRGTWYTEFLFEFKQVYTLKTLEGE